MPQRTVADRFWAKVDTTPGPLACWTWRGALSTHAKRPARSPRPVFWLRYDDDRRQIILPAARVALWLTDGVPLEARGALEACHTCNHPWCVNPAHLYWGTPDQNRADRYPARYTSLEGRRVEKAALGDLLL